MNELLTSLLIPLTVLLSVVLLSHHFLLSKLGARTLYLFWGLVPLGLILYSLPFNWGSSYQLTDNTIQQFIVLPTQTFQKQFSLEWLIGIWAFISTLMFVYWFISHVQFLKQLTLLKLSKSDLAIELPRKLAVYQSAHAYSPMIIGVINPKLLLPEDFAASYNKEQQALILEHEICHFDRNDIYWNLIAFAFLALFWFHPLVWLAYFRFRRDQELSCDHIVLARKQLASRVNYSRALLVASETSPPLAFAQLSFKKYGDKEIMFERINQIKLNTKASKVSLSFISLLSISLLSGLSYAGNISDNTNEQQYRTPPKVKENVRVIERVEPKYPLKAAEEKIEGSVVLKFDINSNGDVQDVEVMNGIPAYVFDRVAITALKQWKYDANGKYHKNQLVQLDFRMDSNSSFKDVNLIEKIQVTQ
jgi:TonB family protein